MRMATTSGLAGWNLGGRSAAGLAGLGFGCGGHEESFLGVVPDSANLRLENHVCAPSLLKRIATSAARLRHFKERRQEGFGGHEGGHCRPVFASAVGQQRTYGFVREGGEA